MTEIMPDWGSGKKRGFDFVTFDDHDSGDKTVKGMTVREGTPYQSKRWLGLPPAQQADVVLEALVVVV